jgi:hypothetical protein
MRKTIEVSDIKIRLNHALESSSDEMKVERQAIATFAEGILMDTGNYRGFQYLSSEYLPVEEQVQGSQVLKDNFDDTRRRYF